jgi:hypothetical protein
MSNPYALAALEYNAETAFAESSSSFAKRIEVLDAIDPSGLVWEKQEPGAVQQHMQGGSAYVLMGKSGSFKTKHDLTGHGSTTVGSPTISDDETFWGYIWGNVSASLPTSTTLTGGTAAAPTTTASGTFPDGALASIGALGDGDGNGQLYAIDTHDTTTLNLLTALDGAPVNGAVLRAACMFYFPESTLFQGVTSTVPGLRFRFLSANLQYSARGCYPTVLSLTGLSPGERPQAEVTWAVSDWDAVSATFPSALSASHNTPAPVAAGSLFVNDVGTATSAKRTHRSLTIEITMGMQGAPGPAGVGAYQSNVGCRRMPSQIKWSWIEDADATTASPVLQGWGTGTTNKHILATLSTVAGKQVGFYSPNVCVTTVPVQFNNNGINSMRFEGMAYTGTTTTNDLTLSALRMGWA